MGCKEILEFFTDYYDGALSAEQRQLIEVHLHKCSHCEKSYQFTKASIDALTAYPQLEASAGFESRLWRRVQQNDASWWQKAFDWLRMPNLQSTYATPVFAMAVALVFLGAGAYMLQDRFLSGTAGSSQAPVLVEQSALAAPGFSRQSHVNTADNPLLEAVSSTPRRFVMPHISSEQFDDAQPRLLRGAGEGEWVAPSTGDPKSESSSATSEVDTSHVGQNSASSKLRF